MLMYRQLEAIGEFTVTFKTLLCLLPDKPEIPTMAVNGIYLGRNYVFLNTGRCLENLFKDKILRCHLETIVSLK